MSWLKDAELTTEEDKAQAKREQRIAELVRKLAATDHKAMPDYDKPNDEILKQRQEWRDEIRELKQ